MYDRTLTNEYTVNKHFVEDYLLEISHNLLKHKNFTMIWL